MTPEELIEEAAGRLREYGYGDLADGIEDLFVASNRDLKIEYDTHADTLNLLEDILQERTRLKNAIEEAKKFLTDARETSEMRNRNAYGVLKEY